MCGASLARLAGGGTPGPPTPPGASLGVVSAADRVHSPPHRTEGTLLADGETAPAHTLRQLAVE